MVAIAALFLSAFIVLADEPELVEVIAVGAGMTQDEAHKAADKAAVQQVVGTIVDTTTLVEKDEVVEDKVLTYSAALIADSKIIGTPKKGDNGLITLKVKATVKKTALKEKLTAAKLVSVAIDGESLWAQAVSAKDNLADAEAMIKDLLAKYMACIVAGTIPGQNGVSPIDFDPKTGKTIVNVRVGIDMSKYRQFVKEVLDKLGPMAKGKGKVSGMRRSHYMQVFPIDAGTEQTGAIEPLLILQDADSVSATVLFFGKNEFDAVRNALDLPISGSGDCGQIAVSASILDKDNVEIGNGVARASAQETATASRNCSLVSRSMTGNGIVVAPFVCFDAEGVRSKGFARVGKSGGGELSTFSQLRIPVGTFTPDELKAAGKLEIKIGHMKNGQFTEK